MDVPSVSTSAALARLAQAGLVALLVAVAGVGMVVASPMHDGTPRTAGPVIERDAFDRADRTRTMGRAPEGRAWTALVGTWGIDEGEAVLRQGVLGEPEPGEPEPGEPEPGEPEPGEPEPLDATSSTFGLAAIASPVGARAVYVTMSESRAGCGLAFDVSDAENFWALVLVPAYATWNLYQVRDGTWSLVTNTGFSYIADETILGVSLSSLGVELRVADLATRVDGVGSDALERVGLVAGSSRCTSARWENVAWTR